MSALPPIADIGGPRYVRRDTHGGCKLLREGLLTEQPLLLQYRGGPQVAARRRRGCHAAECFDKPIQSLGCPLVNIAGATCWNRLHYVCNILRELRRGPVIRPVL